MKIIIQNDFVRRSKWIAVLDSLELKEFTADEMDNLEAIDKANELFDNSVLDVVPYEEYKDMQERLLCQY